MIIYKVCTLSNAHQYVYLSLIISCSASSRIPVMPITGADATDIHIRMNIEGWVINTQHAYDPTLAENISGT